jgi:outer membrane protein assembly factor BamB
MTALIAGNDQAPAKVITSTTKSATAHSRMTGDILWEVPGSYMFAAPLVLNEHIVILADDLGHVVSLDAHTAAINWSADLGFPVLTASPIAYGDRVLVPGAGGQLAVLDAATGTVIYTIQVAPTSLTSTPVMIGDFLIVGGQDGKIRAVRFPV